MLVVVKCVDTIPSESHINIVLEYIENGSLARMGEKFGGCFSEQLVAIYVKQVLQGLKYLHEQGVIHRDIKSANLLTSNDAGIKISTWGLSPRLVK